MPVDNRLKSLQVFIQAQPGIEAELAGQNIWISHTTHQVVEENALLGRGQWIDILDIGRTARHTGDDPADLLLGQLDQREHLRQDGFAASRDAVGRNFDGGRSGMHCGGQRGHCGGGKDRTHANLKTAASHTLGHGDRQQRVSTEFKEVVMTADAFEFEDFGPNLGQFGFELALWRFVTSGRVGIGIRSGQRLAVQFAVGCQGQGRQAHIGCWHHILGQARGQA